MPERIYLDHAATTPILPAAQAAVAEGMRRWANPSSPHAEGRAAHAALEEARARIKAALAWDGELIFTSGATEAIAIALRGRGVYETIVSAVEHDAVMRHSEGWQRIGVDANGLVENAYLRAYLDPREATDFIAVQAANNETGVLQPFDEIIATIRADWVEKEVLVLADCAQTAGRQPLPDADMIAVSAHKLGGPPGIGALLVRDLAKLDATGGQERGYRGGTENLPAILGFAAALEAAEPWLERAAALRVGLEKVILAEGGEVIGARAPRLPTIGAYRMPGVPAAAQLIHFDLAGIAVSAGSACSSGSLKTSHVLTAMGMDQAAAAEVIRVSFGPSTGEADIEAFLGSWRKLNARRRAA